jgi:Protein of unknown function (DUF3237)
MRLSTGWMLAPVVFGIGLVGDWASAEPTVTIETEYLMTLEAPLDPAFQVVGQRVIVNVPAGGTVHGPKINGTLIPPSGDWLIPMPDGSTRIDVRATIKTDDGELIFVEYNGVIFASKEVNDRFGKGEVITSKDEYFVTAPRFTTASKKYEWINHLQAVGKMVTIQNTKVTYDIFAVR